MISLNNLLNYVIKFAGEFYQSNDGFNKIETKKISIKEESKGEVVIINPTHDGYGDFELARKLEKLITSKGLQTTIVSLIKKCNYESFPFTESYENISGEPKSLRSKFVIIAPFSFCRPEVLIKVFKDNIIINEEMKILMIDEIEADLQYAFDAYKHQFEKIGIKHICEEKLGFGKNCTGYLPIEESVCADIKQRSKIELEKLFDKFNLNVDFSAHYYISYLNSDVKITASQVFIVNTLCNVKENPSSVNYIFSLGKGDWESDVERVSKGARGILSILEKIDRDIADKFSRVNKIIVDVYKNKISHTELQNKEREGIPINVIFMNSKQIPKNIWHDFIAISKSGIMTGDQSLCDYLSIKKEMPFYEMQKWKWPLRQSLIDSAKEFKGEELKKYVKTKIFGRMPPRGDVSYQFVNNSILNDELENDFQNFGRFLSQKIANNAIEAHLKNETLLESNFSVQKG